MKKFVLSFLLVGGCLFAHSLAFATDGDTKGKDLYTKHCASCHGASGEKATIGVSPINALEPAVVAERLKGYQDDTYGYKNKKMMQMVLKKVTPEELESIKTHTDTFERVADQAPAE